MQLPSNTHKILWVLLGKLTVTERKYGYKPTGCIFQLLYFFILLLTKSNFLSTSTEIQGTTLLSIFAFCVF
jgi:hypothetical protein